MKTVYGPTSSTRVPVRSADGSLLTVREDIVQRWSEHFSQLLNRPSPVDWTAIHTMPQRPFLSELDSPPTLDETIKAIQKLQPGKAAGPDGIPPEIFKEGRETLAAKLTEVLLQFWRSG